jgi:hypothetical protein
MAMSAGSRQQGAGSYRLQQAGWPGREHYVAAAAEQEFWSATSLRLGFVDYKGATGLRMDPAAVGAVLCIKGRRAALVRQALPPLLPTPAAGPCWRRGRRAPRPSSSRGCP